jgi:hypothetical protein
MAILVIVFSPIKQTPTQTIAIFLMYLCLFWILAYMLLLKGKEIGRTGYVTFSLVAIVLCVIFGYYMVEFFGVAGYIAEIIGIGGLALLSWNRSVRGKLKSAINRG